MFSFFKPKIKKFNIPDSNNFIKNYNDKEQKILIKNYNSVMSNIEECIKNNTFTFFSYELYFPKNGFYSLIEEELKKKNWSLHCCRDQNYYENGHYILIPIKKKD